MVLLGRNNRGVEHGNTSHIDLRHGVQDHRRQRPGCWNEIPNRGGTAEVAGTKRSIKFSEPVTITIETGSGGGSTTYADATYNGVKYAEPATFEAQTGDTIIIRVDGSNAGARQHAYVQVNGEKVLTSAGTYNYVVTKAATIRIVDVAVRVTGRIARAGQASITEE